MDALDMQILEALRDNARRSLTEISKNLGVSDVTVHTRVKELLESKIIKGFTTIIDYERIGYPVTAFVRLTTKLGNLDAIIEILAKFPWVLEIYEISRDFDLLLKVKASSLVDLRNKVVNDLGRIENILTANATPVLGIRKESNLPLTNIKVVRGFSGVLHEFADVTSDVGGVESLIDRYETEVTGREILMSYIKSADVKSHRIEVIAPSFTEEAQELAKLYKIELKPVAVQCCADSQ